MVRSMFETNFYLAYGLSVVNALTRKPPTVRFEPNSPREDVDVTAASAANKLVDLIKRNNNLLSLMADMGRFFYTDGRCSFFTRYVKDGQRFGWIKPDDQKADNPEESAAEAGRRTIGRNCTEEYNRRRWRTAWPASNYRSWSARD